MTTQLTDSGATPGPTPGPSVGPTLASCRRVAVVPVLLVVAVTVVVGLAGYLDSLTTAAERSAVHSGRGAVTGFTGAVLVAAAAVVLAARPRHLVGAVLAGLGLLWAADGLMESWAAYSSAHDLPGTDFAVWFVARLGAFLLLGLPLLLVLYPTGRLMPGRWRGVSVATIAAAVCLPVALQVAPDSVVFRDLPVPGVRTDWAGLPLSDDAAVGLLTVTRVLTLLSLLGGLAVVVARHRRAEGLERTQLRWLLWAGIVCVISVAVLLLVPSGTLTTVVLSAAVVTTAASVTIGVVRPELADVDALVAGTLTYAGVAAVVVAIDLAALAAAGAWLGDRMDERDVSLLVLVLAVAVYGPLRAWLGAGVRRVMFGRRGDRYGVVSSFAAHRESTRRVEEQLPALAGAVAETFKVPFPR